MQTINQQIRPISLKTNQAGNLQIGGCDLAELAKKYETPLYIMCEETLRGVARQYQNAFQRYPKIKMTFASKALMVSAIAKVLHQEGFGFDVVSGGEIATVVNAGIELDCATFNGSNKSLEEIEYALNLGIGRVSVDNFYEIELLSAAALKKGVRQKIMLRVTPGIECHTHEYIQTGHLDSKFGFDLTQIDEAIEKIKEAKNLELVGLHAHIGSQIFETRAYHDEIEVLIKEIARIKTVHKIEISEMNIGGGLGITYTETDTPPSIFEIADVIIGAIEKNIQKYSIEPPILYIEPGRSIVGTAGVTLYTLGSSKQVPNGRKYISVDGGMSDNPRPSMYGAKYTAELVRNNNDVPQKVRIAGKHCESGDILIDEIELNSPKAGDLIVFYNTGAYGYSMSSNYNRILKPAMVLVNNSQSDIIINRETYSDLVRNDIVPGRL